MAVNEEAVSAESATAPTDTAGGGVSPASGVDDVAPPADRSWREVKGELERKFTEGQTLVQRQLAELAQAVQTLSQTRTAPVAQTQDYTDEQLAQLAAAGNAEALRQLVERNSARHAQVNQQFTNEQNLTRQELAVLAQKYPSLSDLSSPLRQSAEQAYRLLLSVGRPQDDRTRVDAILRAVADQGAQPVATNPNRSMPPSAALDGSSPRRQAPQQQGGPRRVTPKEVQIGKRYGLTEKQAQEALVNFEKRNAAGRSNITPNVSRIIEQQEGQ